VMVIVDFSQFEFGKKFEKDSFDMQRNMTSWNLQSLPSTVSTGGTKAADTIKNGTVGSLTKEGAGTDKAASGTVTGGTPASGTAATGSTGTVDAASGKTPAGAAAAGSSSSAPAASGKTPSGAPAANATNIKQKATQLQFGVVEPYYTPTGVKQQDVNEIKLGEEKAVMLRYSGKYNYTLVESQPQSQTVSLLPGDIVDLGYTLGVVTGDVKQMLTWTYDGIEFRLSTADLPRMEMIKVAQAVQGETGK
jgi:hypothetical protein